MASSTHDRSVPVADAGGEAGCVAGTARLGLSTLTAQGRLESGPQVTNSY